MNTTEYGKIIGKNLRRIALSHDKTQTDIAKYLGVNKSTVSSWFNGNRIPRMDKIDRLCTMFNVSRSDIMEPHNQSPLLSAFESLYNKIADASYESSDESSAKSSDKSSVIAEEDLILIKAFHSADPGIQQSVMKLLDIKF